MKRMGKWIIILALTIVYVTVKGQTIVYPLLDTYIQSSQQNTVFESED